MKILDVIEGHYLLISAYHCNRIIKIDSTGQQHISYPKPMGIGVSDNTVAIAAKTGIWLCDHTLHPHTYHVTGETQTHDVIIRNWGVVAFVNTRDNAICELTQNKPPYYIHSWQVPDTHTEDEVHLNGMTDDLDIVTMLSEDGNWRQRKLHAGAIWSLEYGHMIGGLCMPHSPTQDTDGKLWYLESGRGWLCHAGMTVGRLPGYTRGLTFHNGYAFVCTSHGRESDFEGVPILKDETRCGVHMVNVGSGEIEDSLILDDPVRELYSVKVVKQP